VKCGGGGKSFTIFHLHLITMERQTRKSSKWKNTTPSSCSHHAGFVSKGENKLGQNKLEF